jgi:NAD(P)H-dependent FMN reductase
MKIEIIGGSPRKESVSIRAALHLEQVLKAQTKHQIGLINLNSFQLGSFQKVFKNIDETPEEYKPLAKRMFEAEAFIIVTPEYNGSYTAAIKNLFDHFPKQSKKAFGIVTTSTGALGGARSSQQLLLYIPALFGIASPYLLITPHVDQKFDISGKLIDEKFQLPIDTFVREFLFLAEKLNSDSR